MHVTATQAKNQFGAICAHAKIEPVFVEKDGRVETVILSAKQFAALSASSGKSSLAALAEKRKVFEETYKAWLEDQNARIETQGIWCDDLRVW